MTRIFIDIPDDVWLPPGFGEDQAVLREAVAVGLYRRDKLSFRQARQLASMDRRQFETLLASYGVPQQDEGDLPDILNDIDTF